MSHHSRRKQPLVFQVYKIVIIGISFLLIIIFLFQHSSLYYRTNLVPPFAPHINKQELYLIKGEEFRLYVFGFKKHVSYTTTNFRVAGVNFNGRVFAHRTGKAFIIARVDGKEFKCRVYVIDLNQKKLELKVGKSYRLKVYGTNAYTKWESSDKKVATVNAFGKIKAKSKGKTVIYAKVKGKKLKCTVWVK